jgi:hypothetical protein
MKRACGISMIRLAAAIALGIPVPLIGTGQPTAVTYVFNNLPPADPGRLLASSGAVEIRRLSGVASYRVGYRPGDRLPGGVSTDELDVLRGAATDHAGMLATIKSALRLSRFTFEVASGPTPLSWSGAELPGAESLYREPPRTTAT